MSPGWLLIADTPDQFSFVSLLGILSWTSYLVCLVMGKNRPDGPVMFPGYSSGNSQSGSPCVVV